jgi:putative protease
MAEGRCYLSSYLTGESPNTVGACSPAKFVSWEENNGVIDARLNGALIDRVAANESAGYPTLCKGRFHALNQRCHVLESPTSLNTLNLLPRLQQAGVAALKIEGRQRSPAYVAQVVRVWREALDFFQNDPEHFAVKPQWQQQLQQVSEGAQTTLGAYERDWQ